MKTIYLIALLILIEGIVIAQNSVPFSVNNVQATIQNKLSPFYIDSTNESSYNIVHGDSVRPIFYTGLWIGGKDVNDSIYLSMHSGPDDEHYTYGPISTDTSISFNQKYNRVWKVTQQDIWYHRQRIITYNSILNWPAHGDTTNGESFYLAPFVDVNGDGLYTPEDGDYPKIKGDEAVFFIMNDQHPNRSAYSSFIPLGVEVHVMIYSFNSSISSVNNTTFINYSIYNRSETDYYDFYVGAYMDADIVCPGDDQVGCDSTRNVVFTFDDADTTNVGYVPCPLPNINTPSSSIGIKFLNRTMEKMVFYTVFLGVTFRDLYRFMVPNSYDPNYYYPNGEQELQTFIPQYNIGDYRIVGTTGVNSFPSHSNMCIDIAYVYYRNDSLSNIEKTINLLKTTDTIQDFYNSVYLDCIGFLTNTPKELKSFKSFETIASPNPATDYSSISFPFYVTEAEIKVFDAVGQKVISKHISNTSAYTIKRGNLKNGIYFYKIIADQISISSGKIIFE